MDVVDFERFYPETSDLLGYIAQCGLPEGVAKYLLRRPHHHEELRSELDTLSALPELPAKAMQGLANTWLPDEKTVRLWFADVQQELQSRLS